MARATIRGVELDYDRGGAGPTLVWGHGLTSSRADDAVPPTHVDADRARARFDVVRYDARGHGRSGFTDDPAGYGWDQLALDQLALADHLGIDRYAAGGSSMGAGTALHVAVAAPERVEALVLVIPPTGWGTRAGQTDNYLRMADLIEAGRLDHVLAAGRLVPPPDPFVEVETWHERSADRLRSFESARLAGLFRGAATADLPPPEALAEVRQPTLILAWSGDPAHPVETARRLAEVLPDTTVVEATTASEVATWTDRMVDFLLG